MSMRAVRTSQTSRQTDGRTDRRTEGQVKTGMYVHIRVAGTLHVAHLSLPRAACVVCPKIPLSLGLAARVGGQLAAPFPQLPSLLLSLPLSLSLLLSFLLLSAVRALAKDLWRGAQGLPRRSQKAIRLSQSLISIILRVCMRVCMCECVCVSVCLYVCLYSCV